MAALHLEDDQPQNDVDTCAMSMLLMRMVLVRISAAVNARRTIGWRYSSHRSTDGPRAFWRYDKAAHELKPAIALGADVAFLEGVDHFEGRQSRSP